MTTYASLGWTILAASLVSLLGCNGTFGNSKSSNGISGEGGTEQPGGRANGDTKADGVSAVRSALRRLSNEEYLNTVSDLFSLAPDDPVRKAVADSLPGEGQGESGFHLPGPIGKVEVGRFRNTAEKLVGARPFFPGKGSNPLLPCTPDEKNPAPCVREFVTSFGGHAFRRPIADTEVAALLTLFDEARAIPEVTTEEAVRAVAEAMLQMPQFLYHTELLPAPGSKLEGLLVQLDGYAIAARLSYFLWQTMPDEALLAAAREGKLQTEEDVIREARRLLADPKAHHAVENFFAQVLKLDKLPGVVRDEKFPATSMAREARDFVNAVVFDEGGRLETLLTASFSFIDGPLAKHYGLPPVAGSAPVRVDLPSERSGLLTLGALLTSLATPSTGSPITRGRFVRERMLCQKLGSIPAGIPPLPPKKTGTSVRELFAGHTSNPTCAGCHRLMDPIGFGFLAFDQVGRFQTKEDDGLLIDDTGNVINMDGADKTFRGVRELASALATSDEARACAVQQWFSFANGGDSEIESPAFKTAYNAFASSDFDIRTLLIAVATSPSFRYRAPSSGEVLP